MQQHGSKYFAPRPLHTPNTPPPRPWVWGHKVKIQLFQNIVIVSKGAKIRNRYNQVPCLTQDTNWKVTNSQLDTINESHEVRPFPAGDHRAHVNRRIQRHGKHKTEKTP